MPVTQRARLFASGTIVAGTAVIVTAAVGASHASLSTLSLLCAAAVIAELFQVASDETSLDPVDAQTVSFSSGVHVAAVIMVGPWDALLIAAFGVLVVDSVRRAPLRRLWFNIAGFALATLVGGLAFESLGGTTGQLDLPRDVVAVAGLALAYSSLNTLLVGTVVSLSSGAALRPLLRDIARAEASFVAAEASLGVALAVLALTNAWYVVALVPLLVAVYGAHANLVLMRRETGRALETFANVVDERDSYTYRHSKRVADYVVELAERLDLAAGEIARLRWAGRLHDLGKIAVDQSVLGKASALEPAEWEAMRRHPRLSARLLGRFRFATREARAVEYHHERYDGKGYYGIAGDTLPTAAHFLIVADSFDAMTTDRPYRRGLSEEEALNEIERGLGTQFHPAVGRAFVASRRGLDPRAVLSSAELSEITRPSLAHGPWRERLSRLAAEPTQLLVVCGVLAGLLALGGGPNEAGLVAAALGVLTGATAAVCAFRARRLRGALTTATGGDPSRTLGAVAAVVDRECGVHWAATLSWPEAELNGTIVSQWGNEFRAPSEAAFTSWLIRESESTDAPLLVPGAELGSTGTHFALPLHAGEGNDGFLLLAFSGRIPRHVRHALVAVGWELGPVLLRTQAAPDARQPLRAVASL